MSAPNPVLDFFALQAPPFALTPNPELFFPWDHPQAVLAGLEFALQRGDGLLKVSGAVGSGKTLLCRLLLNRLHMTGCQTAYLNAPVTEAKYLPLIVAREFGLTPTDHREPYRDLRAFLLQSHAQGKRNVLVVDEAQALGASGLELIRLLSNLETETDKLLQIVLFGQTELDALLQSVALRQITQRIGFHFITQPLPATLTSAYVGFRLQRCARTYRGPELFTVAALQLLAQQSGGWPRLINLLADKAMLAAYSAQQPSVTVQHVRQAALDSQLTKSAPGGWRGWFGFGREARAA